jgi:hypothetical protein
MQCYCLALPAGVARNEEHHLGSFPNTNTPRTPGSYRFASLDGDLNVLRKTLDRLARRDRVTMVALPSKSTSGTWRDEIRPEELSVSLIVAIP